jgi:phosphopantothenoylcysteine decarboxylase / phosphopantothenate---cysteine ligase
MKLSGKRSGEVMTERENKKIRVVLGITGGIAAYKSAELVRLLKKEDFEVRVMMTKHAMHFITPLTLTVLSENKVYTDLFSQEEGNEQIRHISLARWADLIVIAPATANTIGKIANGLADDLISATVLAFKGKTIFAPSMNSAMISNPIYQDNVNYLSKKNYHFIETTQGNLACGEYGDGRMADPINILNAIKRQINTNISLKGKKVLITASSTREPIDEVRFISNRSTGKMGFSLAEAARNRGATVTLVTGPTCLPDLYGIRIIHVNTAQQMREAVMSHFEDSDIFISSAAVSDFKPAQKFAGKIKKNKEKSFHLELEKNVDILKEAGEKKTKQILIGFAAEVTNLNENALEKLKAKNLDYIIANDISREDSGFAVDTNKVLIISHEGAKIDLPLMSKYELAEYIFDNMQGGLENQENGKSQ